MQEHEEYCRSRSTAGAGGLQDAGEVLYICEFSRSSMLQIYTTNMYRRLTLICSICLSVPFYDTEPLYEVQEKDCECRSVNAAYASKGVGA